MKAKLTTAQRRAAIRVLRFYRNRNNEYSAKPVTSVRLTFTATDYGVAWLEVRTRRSDCSKYSERQVFTEQHALICLGKHGSVTVHSADYGITTDKKVKRAELKHVAFMCGGKVRIDHSRRDAASSKRRQAEREQRLARMSSEERDALRARIIEQAKAIV